MIFNFIEIYTKFKLKYGNSNSYRYELEEDKMEWLTNKTMRSKGQTLYLFQLVGGDFNKLCDLETKIKLAHISWCPDNLDEIEKIMNIETNHKWFTLYK